MTTGFKVFHFGVAPEYVGRWLTAGTEPGFHIWFEREHAEAYQKRLGGGDVREVGYKGHVRTINEPEGPAVTAEQMFVL